MAAYLRPPGVPELSGEAPLTRHADKTGLIAWQANKYSVPLAYQRSRVGVVETDGQLVISDPGSGAVIARHGLAPGKGAIVKNTHHYRDPAVAIADLEAAIAQRLGATSGPRPCALIKARLLSVQRSFRPCRAGRWHVPPWQVLHRPGPFSRLFWP